MSDRDLHDRVVLAPAARVALLPPVPDALLVLKVLNLVHGRGPHRLIPGRLVEDKDGAGTRFLRRMYNYKNPL